MAATVRQRGVQLVPVRAVSRASLIDLDAMARESGLHPELVRRFVRLGLVEPAGGSDLAPLFRPDAPVLLARAGRLRRDLALSYAGAVLAGQLLARIDDLESRLRRYEPRSDRPR